MTRSAIHLAWLACGLAACGLAACSEAPVEGPFEAPLVLQAAAFEGSEPPAREIIDVKAGGLALFDWQGDGDWDLFAPGMGTTESAPTASALFENRAGELTEATSSAALELEVWGQGVAVGDLDGDGLDDLIVACLGADVVLRQDADHRLTADTEALVTDSRWTSAAALGDLDRDGDLDLALVGYVDFDPAAPPPATEFLGLRVFGGPAGMTPLHDRLFENDGEGNFSERTPPELQAAPRPGLGAAILDVNLDGSQDLWIGNDSEPNQLWVPIGDWRFFDTAPRTGLATNQDGSGQATMGLALGDLNGDAAPDLFTTNFARDTNTLQLSDPSGLHRDLTRPGGLAASSRPYCGWGTAFGDYDLDGDLDLVALNGHVYPQGVLQPLGESRAQGGLLYLQGESAGPFPRFELSDSTLGTQRIGRGLLQADLDADGDLDLITRSLDRGVELWRGRGSDTDTHRLIEVRLRQPGPNPTAVGARVECFLGDERLGTQWLTSSGSYQAGLPGAAWFSVPRDARELDLRITWPDGEAGQQAHTAEGPVTIERH
jgi:hypothetical protein